MTQTNARDLWVSWEQYHDLIEQLAVLLGQADFKFNHLVCLARGGLRIGDVLSRVFNVPLAILATSSYRAGAGTEQGALTIAPSLTSTGGALAGKVLLVDDLADSGATFAGVLPYLRQAYPEITEIQTAVLWHKASSAFSPDFVVSTLDANPWIHQPFEAYDTLGIAKLTEKWHLKHQK